MIMRGEVLHFDEELGIGFIAGADGKRYSFDRGELRQHAPIGRGTPLEFLPDGDAAREIFITRDEMPGTGAGAVGRFGRSAAASDAEDTGLWGYFWRGITRNYVNFRGRARRKEFWGYVLFYWLGLFAVSAAAAAADFGLGNFQSGSEWPVVSVVLVVVVQLATFLPTLALLVRRLHDIGLSGWFSLLPIVLSVVFSIVGAIVTFVFGLVPSQKHENQWGPVPTGVRFDTVPVETPDA
ncbi:hypothetical protein MesoLjLb_18200 [Mesorhizobium sp. L-8-3]|nr:hypothetical protein MesoLjLb_18200 [Mesorhizobium sp. L-8-3]